jgi:hypothetical protein
VNVLLALQRADHHKLIKDFTPLERDKAISATEIVNIIKQQKSDLLSMTC